MSGVGVNELNHYLWPQGESLSGPQVYLLVDGARLPGIAAQIRRGRLEYSCLFSGRLTPRLQAAAPYLVHLSASSPFSQELLTQTWGSCSAIFTVTRPEVTLEQLRRHFKKFLRVRNEAGQVLQFRFYDPRVLRIYLPTCTAQELQSFFGPVSRILMEPADGAAPLDYALQLGELVAAQASVPDIVALAVPPGLGAPERGAEALDVAQMGMHHVQTYCALQSEGDIRRWTGLPVLTSVAAARQWVREQLERPEIGLCVIRHPDHGVIGAWRLLQQGSAAIVQLWIGKEYRGHGYGHAALRLLQEYAFGREVRRLFTAATALHPAAVTLLQQAGAAPVPGDRGVCFCLEQGARAATESLSAELEMLLDVFNVEGLPCT